VTTGPPQGRHSPRTALRRVLYGGCAVPAGAAGPRHGDRANGPCDEAVRREPCAPGRACAESQVPWITWVTPLMICCTAIAESIMPASRVTSTTPPSLMILMISSEWRMTSHSTT
jgi:hypothetical protein